MTNYKFTSYDNPLQTVHILAIREDVAWGILHRDYRGNSIDYYLN